MSIHMRQQFEIHEDQDGLFNLVLRDGTETRRIGIGSHKLGLLAPLNHSSLSDVNDRDCLQWLVHLGELAREKLLAMNQDAEADWNDLWKRFLDRTFSAPSPTGLVSYERWVRILADWAARHRPAVPLPRFLTRDLAARCLNDIAGRYVSVRRMAIFFKRLWETLGWDGDIWKARVRTTESEYYRRLSVGEVRRLARHLSDKGTQVCKALAEVVVLGYYTGLRLSDIVELETGELDADGTLVRLRPNKTRGRCRRLLAIPLVGEARICAAKRLAAMTTGEKLLFPELVGIRTSRLLCAAFRACRILKHDNGRASFHSLRATFISMMDEAGIPPHVTDAITGHSGGGMHARYSQPSISARATAIRNAIIPLEEKAGSDGVSES